MNDIRNFDISAIQNELLENFGDKYIHESLRVMNTKTIDIDDIDMLHEALSILVGIYFQKIKDGEINKGRSLH